MCASLIAILVLLFISPALAQKNEGLGVVAPAAPAQKPQLDATMPPPPTMTLGSPPPKSKPAKKKPQSSNPK